MINIPKQNSDAAELTPRKIVAYLDRYIIGQDHAKRSVALALRNRWRRQQLPEEIAEEIIPKNILIIGPTGVGKTEIARRIARLTRSPFIKVEASKFTEVGYVGRDVESMVRDLTELSVNMVKLEHREIVRARAEILVEERLLDLLLPRPVTPVPVSPPTYTGTAINTTALMSENQEVPAVEQPDNDAEESYRRTRDKLRKRLKKGALNEKTVDLEVRETRGGMIEVFSSSGIEEIGMQIKDMMPGMFNQKKKRRKLTVEEARRILTEEEEERLVDMDRIVIDAIDRVENSGIIFIDEIDKVAGREGGSGPDVSREGVQRDLLPIVEGSTISTKYGMVKSNHILFIAAGAFSVSKPSDLIPELQGRFPVKVDVHSLTREQMCRILSEPENALTKQYQALLSTEETDLQFDAASLDAIAALAEEVNMESEDIGARRLHTILELLLEELSYHASEMPGQSVTITREYVHEKVTTTRIIEVENVRKKRRVGFR